MRSIETHFLSYKPHWVAFLFPDLALLKNLHNATSIEQVRSFFGLRHCVLNDSGATHESLQWTHRCDILADADLLNATSI